MAVGLISYEVGDQATKISGDAWDSVTGADVKKNLVRNFSWNQKRINVVNNYISGLGEGFDGAINFKYEDKEYTVTGKQLMSYYSRYWSETPFSLGLGKLYEKQLSKP